MSETTKHAEQNSMVEASLSVSSLSLQQQSETLPHFVRPPDDKYECVHCKRTLRPPVKQTQCGHRLCGICVDEVFAEGENVACPGDEDCDTLTRKQVRSYFRLANSLNVIVLV